MNHGNLTMSRTSDIPYHALNDAYEQCLRFSSLKAACNNISDGIKALPVFPYYSLELGELYAAVDGQKFSVERPTIKARASTCALAHTGDSRSQKGHRRPEAPVARRSRFRIDRFHRTPLTLQDKTH